LLMQQILIGNNTAVNLQSDLDINESLANQLTDTQQLNNNSVFLAGGVAQKSLFSSHPLNSSTDAFTVPVTPQHPSWGSAVGERLQWMVNQNINQAEIRLDPPELGSLEVKLVVQKDSAHVNFVSQHAAVRDAVEDAMPRLREMLNEVGLTLGDVNVSQESFKQQMAEGDAGEFQGESHRQDELGTVENDDSQIQVRRGGNGLLDIYA
ncbi:flagellar hook-length control protein FliK, partial [Kaarinaea lacus]